MPLLLLLLLLLLAPLGTASTQEDAAKGVPGPALARGRRQVDLEDDFEDYSQEYYTDPPETLTQAPGAATTDFKHVTSKGHVVWTGSVGLGTSELSTVEAATKPVTQQVPITADLATELSSVNVSATEAPLKEEALSMQPAATETETTQPTATETETTQPAATETETTQTAAMEAETTQTAATEAETTQTAATEAETTQTAATEAEIIQTIAMEAETTQPAATEALPMSFTAIETLSTEPIATLPVSTEPDTTEFSSMGLTHTITFLGHSVTRKDTTVVDSNLFNMGLKKGQAVPTRSSMAPSPTEASGRIPVRQCLLAILILALVATVFLVCTVVLAVRLSRKGHRYPVRNYSPTEMVCISSLLPDGGEGGPAAANGGVAKGYDLKAEGREDHEGDDLTLHSFLP
ncbi:P-selectin glycoprotein ligand 1 isoform X2 [Heterocephalus glaber]|nr:P-selectin glycoprotein ligand 1 isoform X2 [Heterocephalus glaber]XP_021112982.1 P-selectin glycoprotein ligand 1 isoform X2 [Heterocephalus glaber]XP_021112983.1 P-selectin glycoprotein ligand 1 isoform X2 [Heterocephalus glaber]XP_021112984.1 P-selectin glycoprotein ligand 1 isoform X2 [Heterocephalus glaber]